MKVAHILYALGALLLFGGGVYVTTAAKGIRNNNPANIEKGDNWQGMVGDDGRFVIFETPLHGLRAMARIMRTYANKYGINTIEGIVSRWAPPSENDTLGYIDFVASKTGINARKVLSTSEYPQVMAAMIHMENGEQPYSMSDIVRGFEWGFYG